MQRIEVIICIWGYVHVMSFCALILNNMQLNAVFHCFHIQFLQKNSPIKNQGCHVFVFLCNKQEIRSTIRLKKLRPYIIFDFALLKSLWKFN